MSSSSDLYRATETYLTGLGHPVDFEGVVMGVQAEHPQFSSYEIKDAIWSLLDDRRAQLSPDRELIVVRR
jgi:hypothetical protein